MRGKVIGKDYVQQVKKNYEVEDSTPILRYMDFSKYVYILESNKLHFTEARLFEDIYEGALPKSFLNFWPEEERTRASKIFDSVNNLFSTYLSCWNLGDTESYAMWKIYTNPITGVCIKTTVGKLKRALNTSKAHVFKVKYVDFDNLEDKNHEVPILYVDYASEKYSKDITHVFKSIEYKYENEVRAIIVDMGKEIGLDIEVDLEELIDEIIISPFAPRWFDNLVRNITQKFLPNRPIIFKNSNIGIR